MKRTNWQRRITDRRSGTLAAAVLYAAYLVAFPFTGYIAGTSLIALTGIPVVIAGFALGPRWGFLVGLSNILINVLLFSATNRGGWIISSAPLLRMIIGVLVPMATGAFGNVYRELLHRTDQVARKSALLEQEIVERQAAERALTLARDDLDRRVQERTAELRQSEERYRVISEIMSDYAFAMRIEPDGQRVHEWLAGAFSRITGYAYDAGSSWETIIHPDDRDLLLRRMREQWGVDAEHRVRCVTKSGETRWLQARMHPEWDAEHTRVVRIYGAVQDITERTRAEDSLRTAHEYTRSIIDSSLDMIVASDMDGRITEFNRAAQKAFGYTLEQAQGRPIEMLYGDPATGALVHDNVAKAGQITLEVTNRRKDASLFPALLSASVLRNSTGTIVGFMGISRDITESKRVAEALRASEAKSQALVNAIPDMMVRINRSGVVLDIKPGKAARQVMPAGDVIGRTVGQILAQSAELPHAAIRQLMRSTLQALESGETQVFESQVPRPQGSRYYETRLVVSGKDETLAIIRDITERKQAEAERERLFEQVRSSREQLIALSQRLVETEEVERRHIARELHDQVGQNLTGLSINLNIIGSQVTGDRASLIARRVEDSLRLVDATVGRIRDVMAELRPAVLDDYGLLAGLRWLGTRFAERACISIQVQGDEFAPRLAIEKETALFRIAQEALNNIAKHAHATQVFIRLEAAGETARLSISDNGVGFASDEPRPGEPRMSWGLSLMRERARGVGGEFFIDSAVSRGTEITVELPR